MNLKFGECSIAFPPYNTFENAWSNSIAEAMFVGVPMILTDAGYTNEFFTDGLDCVLIPPNDPKALADAVVRLLNDKKLSKKIVEKRQDCCRYHKPV